MLPEDRPNLMQLRAEIARAARRAARHPDDAAARDQVEALRAEYHARQLEEHIRRTVAAAPALSPEQRSRLAVLLNAGAAA